MAIDYALHSQDTDGGENGIASYVAPKGIVPQTWHERGLVRQSVATAGYWLVWLAVALLDVLLAIRIVLKLLSPNASAHLALNVYTVTHILLTPFSQLPGIVTAHGATLEISTLLAMFTYTLLAGSIARLFWLSSQQTHVAGRSRKYMEDGNK